MNDGDFILDLLKSHLNWVQIFFAQIHFTFHAKSPNLVIMLPDLGVDNCLQFELSLDS